MTPLSGNEQRELYAQAFRIAYSECGSIMDCLESLQIAAQECNDDKVVQIAKDGLAVCRPIFEDLERMKAHLGLS